MTNEEKLHYEKLATDDVRIREIKELISPLELLSRLKESTTSTQNILNTRAEIHHILHGADDRLLVIVGPCSIHDTKAGLEYASRLLSVRKKLSKDLLIVMRVYFEKPRTTVGWKGLINDPHLDGSYDINKGLVHQRAGELGRYWRAHHGIPSASRARFGFILPSWF
jgi:3-deoxy-7-phosphoheptulonate synthase